MADKNVSNSPETDKISIGELERQIFDLEEVKIVIRGNRNELVNPYPYERKTPSTTSISSWVETRLKPVIGNLGFEIIQGDGTSPHGRKNIENVRNSYKD